MDSKTERLISLVESCPELWVTWDTIVNFDLKMMKSWGSIGMSLAPPLPGNYKHHQFSIALRNLSFIVRNLWQFLVFKHLTPGKSSANLQSNLNFYIDQRRMQKKNSISSTCLSGNFTWIWCSWQQKLEKSSLKMSAEESMCFTSASLC